MTVTDTNLARLPRLPPSLAVGAGGILAGSPGPPAETSSSATDFGAVSDAGVQYATGAASSPEQDLSSAGFGLPWGQTRTWTSGPRLRQSRSQRRRLPFLRSAIILAASFARACLGNLVTTV